MKGQRSSSQISAFLVNGDFITEENDIRDMWADHFEVLGTRTVSLNFDNEFANSISTHIQNIFENCINDPTGALNEPLTYEEVAGVCSNLNLLRGFWCLIGLRTCGLCWSPALDVVIPLVPTVF